MDNDSKQFFSIEHLTMYRRRLYLAPMFHGLQTIDARIKQEVTDAELKDLVAFAVMHREHQLVDKRYDLTVDRSCAGNDGHSSPLVPILHLDFHHQSIPRHDWLLQLDTIDTLEREYVIPLGIRQQNDTR